MRRWCKRERVKGEKNQAIAFQEIFIVVDISFADIYIDICEVRAARVHCLDEVKRVRPS